MTKPFKKNPEISAAEAQAARVLKEAAAAEKARRASEAKATLLATDADYRVFERFLGVTGKRAIRTNEITKATLKAMGDNLHHWLENQSEALRAEVFAAMEFGATHADAKRIAKHPLRPVIVTELVAAKDAEAQAVKEEQAAKEQQAAEAVAQNANDKNKDRDA